MKIIIDTNVLISAAFRDRLPETVILWILANPEWEQQFSFWLTACYQRRKRMLVGAAFCRDRAVGKHKPLYVAAKSRSHQSGWKPSCLLPRKMRIAGMGVDRL